MEPSLGTHDHGSLLDSRHRLHLRSGTYRSLMRIWSNFPGDRQDFSTPNVLQELIRQDKGDDEATQTSEKETHESVEAVGIERTQPDILLNDVQVEPLNEMQVCMQVPAGFHSCEDESGKAVRIEHTQPDVVLNGIEDEPSNEKKETHKYDEAVGIEHKQPDIILGAIDVEPLSEKKEAHESGEAVGIGCTQPDIMLNDIQIEPLNEKQVCLQMHTDFLFCEDESGEDVGIELTQSDFMLVEVVPPNEKKDTHESGEGVGMERTQPDSMVNVVQVEPLSESQACLQMPTGFQLLEDESGEAVGIERTQPDTMLVEVEPSNREKETHESGEAIGFEHTQPDIMLNDVQVEPLNGKQDCLEMPYQFQLLRNESGEVVDIDCIQPANMLNAVEVGTADEKQAFLPMPSGSTFIEDDSGETAGIEHAQSDNMLDAVQVQTRDERQICLQMPSGSRLLEDEDFEEGEISGDIEFDYNLSDMCLRDSIQVETVDEEQVQKDIIDGRDVLYSEMAHLIRPNNLLQNSENVERTASKNQKFSSKEKSEVDSVHKKARKISERRVAKRKQKYRKNRAEKNRMLGVERLKLKMVVKPKPVNYCNHYLKGRCHEGEKCKFSHDTIPLTKSSPCCYFARQSCLKGDDCPFDHDLSKYPCTNFTTNGFCNRGDACMFSHKDIIPSGIDAQKTDPARPSSGLSHTMAKQNINTSSHQNVGAKSFSFGVPPDKSDKQSMEKTPNQTCRIASSVMENTTEIPVKKPSVAPRGISFLSFGQTSSEPDNSKKTDCLETDKVAGSSSTAETPMKATVYQSAIRRPEKTQKRNHDLAVAPKGISIVSPGRDSRDCVSPFSASDKDQRPSAKQFGLSVSSEGHFKSTAKSAQKTLMSALKFAAAFESDKTKKPLVDQAAAGKTETRTGTLGGVKGSNPSKILEFLSKLQK